MHRTTPDQVPAVELAGGTNIPQLGYGTYLIEPDDCMRLVPMAIDAGYRHFDTARIYHNEEAVGRSLRESGVPRSELFVTTKLWSTRQAYDDALRAFDQSLARLGLDYVDLYLIHWPSAHRGTYVDAWKALVSLHADGRAASIGVSNFERSHLEHIAEATGVMPAVNQIELHPYLQQQELRSFHAQHGIATEAWSPLGQGTGLLADPILQQLAGETGRTAAQVVLRWHIQTGTIAIPKTVTPARITENIDIFGFALTDAQMRQIERLDRNGRIGPHPDHTSW